MQPPLLRRSSTIGRRDGSSRFWISLAVAGNLVFWTVAVVHELVFRGLFPVLGVDWSRFWGAAQAFNTLGPRAAYQLTTIHHGMEPLARFTPLGDAGVRVGPVPYPPIFVAFFSIFTMPPAPLGYVAWTLFSLTLIAVSAVRLTRVAGIGSTFTVLALLLGTFPLLMSLFSGQVVVLLLVFLTESLIALLAGKELLAGWWAGLLLLKPQYAVCLLLVFLFKRRWSAVLGAVLAGMTLLVTSLAVGGLDGLIGYVSILMNLYPRYQGNVAISPAGMISWRAILVTFLPQLGATAGLVLTAILTLATLATLPFLWRGRWRFDATYLAPRLLGTFCVTMLVAYHSQIHGAALLAVPAIVLGGRALWSNRARQLLIGYLVVAPLLGLISALTQRDLALVGPMTGIVMLILLCVLLRDITRADSGRASAPRLWRRRTPATA